MLHAARRFRVPWSVLRDATLRSALTTRRGAADMENFLPLPFHRLARRKVDLDARTAGIEEKQLPQPRRVAVLGQAPQVVFDSARLEPGHIGGRVGSEKGNVIEHAAALGNGRFLHYMQHGIAVIVEPGAGKRESRTRAGGKAENVAIERDRLLGVCCEDGEMIHPGDRHGALLPCLRVARAESPSGAWRDRLVAPTIACQAVTGTRSILST